MSLPQADEQLVEQVRGLLAGEPSSFEDYQAGEGQRAVIPADVIQAPEATRALEHPQGVIGWLWDQVARAAKMVICGPDVYDRLVALSAEEIKTKVDELLGELIARITDRLPVWLRPLVPLIRPIVAQAIAFEIHRALNQGLKSYCGVA
ncbi:hypothetical protein [Candidatus Amarolinea aalborgensis]|jgi:hypothetical protein|uniref:hypothetical protein n=1 Tax=Candidatus Amarolinea aalborgensis TaxID=2249329 RepID=UPI003BF94DB8